MDIVWLEIKFSYLKTFTIVNMAPLNHNLGVRNPQSDPFLFARIF